MLVAVAKRSTRSIVVANKKRRIVVEPRSRNCNAAAMNTNRIRATNPAGNTSHPEKLSFLRVALPSLYLSLF